MYLCVSLHTTTAACPSFTTNYQPVTFLCPGDYVSYTCAINTAASNAVTVWSGLASQCPGNASRNTITLTQGSNNTLNATVAQCGNVTAEMIHINGTCFTSVLYSAARYLNGSTVRCNDGVSGVLIGNNTFNIPAACKYMILKMHAQYTLLLLS